MRGLGLQRLVLFFNIFAYWILAIPVGALLAFVGGIEVAGLWWGWVIGIYLAGIVGIVVMKYFISWDKLAKKAAKRVSSLVSIHINQGDCIEPDFDV